VTFEYVMLKGVNDTLAEARDLVRLIEARARQDQPDPVQPVAGHELRVLRLETIEAFAEVAEPRGLCRARIRTPRGRDILAACGQLRSESVKEKASERLKARLAEKEALAES